MFSQITDTLLMIRPVAFRKNEETAVNNYFQTDLSVSNTEIQEMAVKEFDDFVDQLQGKGIKVIVVEDSSSPSTPDSIFPNNWISFHEDGTIWKYPMFAENRRVERREDIIDQLRQDFEIREVKSLIKYETKEMYLEGTGSMVLDRPSETVFASLSDRTNIEIIEDFCEQNGYGSLLFNAAQSVDGKRLAIYHTNVMMAMGEQFAIVCMDAIDDCEQRDQLSECLNDIGKEVIEISELQVGNFAGNMMQVKNDVGEKFTVMSSAAYECLNPEQIERIEKYGSIIHSPIPTIEILGGGSVRCMMAEVFLPKKQA